MLRLMIPAVFAFGILSLAGCSSNDDELAARDKALQEKTQDLESSRSELAAEKQSNALAQRKLDDANRRLTELEAGAQPRTIGTDPLGTPAKPMKEPKPHRDTARHTIDDSNVTTETSADGGTMYRLAGTAAFDAGKSTLTPAGKTALDKIAAAIKKSPAKVTVEGHTDLTPLTGANKERYKSNQNLSRARATAAMNELVKAGIAKNRIESVGHGDTQPLEKGTSKEANAKNRRIEVIVHGE